MNRRAFLRAFGVGTTGTLVGCLGGGGGGDGGEPAATAPETASATPTPSPTASATASASATSTQPDPVTSTSVARTEAAIVRPFDYLKGGKAIYGRANSAREENDVIPMGWDGDIRNVAQEYAITMARKGFVSHTSPDGKTVEDRYEAAGIDCVAAGETLLQTWWDRKVETEEGTERYDSINTLANGIVDQWMNDERNREVILAEKWNTAGAGVAVTGAGKVYAVLNFCA